jgi:hypothetical protein
MINRLICSAGFLAFSIFFLSACGGGGGGGMGTAVSESAIIVSPPVPRPPPAPDFTDTGIAGSVGAPAPASFGSAPAQLSKPGGDTFDPQWNPVPQNVTFPLIVTGLQKTSTGLSAVPGDQGATATVTVTYPGDEPQITAQLVIPSLGVNQTVISDIPFVRTGMGQAAPDGLTYAEMGAWSQGANQPSNSGTLQNATVFVFGYETPQAAMPTSGTAVFSGEAGEVSASIYKPMNGEIQSGVALGTPSISVNFGSGSVSGSFTQMRMNSQLPWNDVSVAGNIATGTNKFSGTTAAASAPGGPMSLSASATGHIDGAFYGPAAQSLGAVWSLSDGTGSAIGTVVAGH